MGWLHAIGNWIYWFFGFKGSGPYYGAWSGALSDVGEITIVGGLYALWRHHNCASKHCPWIGRHEVEGTGTKTCRLHSTIAKHKELHATHAREHPEQHALLKRQTPLIAPPVKRVTKKAAKPVKVAKKVTKARVVKKATKASKSAKKR